MTSLRRPAYVRYAPLPPRDPLAATAGGLSQHELETLRCEARSGGCSERECRLLAHIGGLEDALRMAMGRSQMLDAEIQTMAGLAPAPGGTR